MTLIQTLQSRLEAAFLPAHLEVTDESARHAGHAGAREGGESHFAILIVSETFMGKSRIERQRMVHQAIKEEMKRIHALSILPLTPEEFQAR